MEIPELKVVEGVNYLSDYIEDNQVLSLALNYFGYVEDPLIIGSIYKLMHNINATKSYNELLNFSNWNKEWRINQIDYLIKPKFLKGYDITYGSAKPNTISHFSKMGAINNLSGTMFDILLYLFEIAPLDAQKMVKTMLKGFGVPIDDIYSILYQSSEKFKNCIDKLQAGYQETNLNLVSRTSQIMKFVEKQKEISSRGNKNRISIGGWIVNTDMRRNLIDSRSTITYMLTENRYIFIDGFEKLIEAKKPLDEEEVELIATSGFQMPWGIAETDEKGEFKKWLIEPRKYNENVSLLDRQGNLIHETGTPFMRAGVLWMFKRNKKENRWDLMIGGDKAPGSSIAAPLNPAFIDMISKNDMNKKMFKDALGNEPDGFVAALEVCFKERDNNIISWADRYKYPMYLPNMYQDKFIGIHEIEHIQKISVKKVIPI